MSLSDTPPGTSDQVKTGFPVAVERQRRVVKRKRRIRRRRLVAVLLILLTPVLYSYVTTMMRPSSLPLGVRSVEWLRTHHGAWLVNEAERIYYTWNAPTKGGPALRTLPTVGVVPVTVIKPSAGIYQPRAIRPLIHPILPGEGVWRSSGRVVDGLPPVLVTTFRSEPAYPRIVAYVAWFDHARTQLALYPGRYEPPNANPRGPIEVPNSQRWRLLATFNSGFLHRDSNGGFFVNGQSVEPLQQGQGTVVAYKNGLVDIVNWSGGATPSSNVVVARQNLPLIVNRGKPNPLLSDGSRWGSTLGNAVRVWRSAVGVDSRGNLIYAAASDQTAATIADILIRAGAVRAIELDINTEWPSLITYGAGGVGNATKVVPNTLQPTNRYLVPDDRDFFAVYRRTTRVALTSVPFG
jgi:phosphodiester glycosidase